MIRPASPADARRIAEVYNHYITQTSITFEETPVSDKDMALRIASVQNEGLPWLVYESEDGICGYAYATKWKERSAYRFAVETTVYLATDVAGNGHGTELYLSLFEELQKLGIHTAIGGITLPNPASVALHEKLGMEKVAQFKEVGLKFGIRLDVGYWQKTL